jgi:alpha-methylacyl-CoA racemase
MMMFHGMRAGGMFSDDRGTNLLDTGAHFYNTYETSDGKYVSVGSIEPQFYAELVRLSGIEGEQLPHQHDRAQWPTMKERLAAVFKTKTRDEGTQIMEGTDVCFAPVLNLPEAYAHPQNVARNTFIDVAGVKQPAPAPRFSRTPGGVEAPPAFAGQHTREVLSAWGVGDDEIAKLEQAGAVKQAPA